MSRSITFRTYQSVTYAVVNVDGDLILVCAGVREDGNALPDANVRIPLNIAAVDGVDPIKVLPGALEAKIPRIIHAAAEWNEADGCWDVSTIERIDDPRAVSITTTLFDDGREVRLRRLEIEEDRLEAFVTITVPIKGLEGEALDSAVAFHDDVIGPLDDIDDDDWRIDVLDHDEGPKVAWWNVSITARSGGSIHDLDEALARRTPWQRAAGNTTRAG